MTGRVSSLDWVPSEDTDEAKFEYLIFKNLFLWPFWVLVAAHRICFSCGIQNLSVAAWELSVVTPGTKPGPPALGVQSLSHWTTAEVPKEVKFGLELNGPWGVALWGPTQPPVTASKKTGPRVYVWLHGAEFCQHLNKQGNATTPPHPQSC